MPSYRTAKGLQLPAFMTGSQSSAPLEPRQHPKGESGERHSWIGHADHLDRLMTLSCRDRGVTSMLLSGFYDLLVECNAAAPWLQGSLSAIRLLTRETPIVLGRMLMDRQPNLAPLWVGATILGLQDEILRDAWRGMISLDLLSAASSSSRGKGFTNDCPFACGSRLGRIRLETPISKCRPTPNAEDTDFDIRGLPGTVRIGRQHTNPSLAKTRSLQGNTAHIPSKHPLITRVWTRTRSTGLRIRRGAYLTGCGPMDLHRGNGRYGSTSGLTSASLTKMR